MKSWKEQLKDVKRELRETGTGEKEGERPAKATLDLSKSRLSDDHSISRSAGESLGSLRPTPAPSITVDRQHRVGGRLAQTVRSPALHPAIAGAVNLSSDESSLPSSRTKVPPIFRPRIDGGRALIMPEWSGTGRSLQHPDRQDGRAATMVVRMGVDFGTAFTKVAIRAGVDLVPIDWSTVKGDDSPTGRYLLPGFVVRAPDGEYCWRRLAESDVRGNLKLPVIEMAGSEECPAATIAYLALVIRYARAFLYRHPEVGRKLVARSLRWELNVGCPTEPHEKPEVVRLFGRIARTAWRLAAEDSLRESDIAAAWLADEAATGLETEPGVVPEFVAQIAGYLGSPQVSEGTHALIDVGAATLDVATFNVVLGNDLDSSPRIPTFFSAVRPLGTHYLYHNRHSRLDLDLEWDDASPVEPADGFAKRYGKRSGEVDAVDDDFVSRVANCIAGVIDGTRTNTRGDPRSLAWREGLPIFVTGGGAGCDVYLRAIDAVQVGMKRRLGPSSRFRFIEMDPLGAKLPQFSVETGGRLTVAVGLTQDAESIARVVPHRDIEPISRVAKERVDHSEIYGGR